MGEIIKKITEHEDVPKEKEWKASTRDNSEYKWQGKHTVGALEVHSEPDLDPRADMTPHAVANKEEDFASARKAFEEDDDGSLKKGFIEAIEGVPVETCCCGIITDTDETIKSAEKHLNQTWCRSANDALREKGFKVDAFVWTWHNISGKSETVILMLRFHKIA